MTSTKMLEPKLEDKALAVTFDDGVSSKFSFRWLKDHSHDEDSHDNKTNQRKIDTASINANEKPSSCDLQEKEGKLVLKWKDTGDSVLPIDLLYRLAKHSDSPCSLGDGENLKLWYQDDVQSSPPSHDFNSVMAIGDARANWLNDLYQYGISFVHNTPVNLESTEKLINQIGYVRHTIYGGMWEFSANLEHEDTAYTANEIGLHTDGTYNYDPAGLQILHCLKFDGTGGENLLVDGFKVAYDLKNENPHAFDILSTVKVPGQYLGKDTHLIAEHEVIKLTPQGKVKQICFNNFDRAPFLMSLESMESFYEALGEFTRRLAMPKYQLKFTLEPGKPLFFDNWRVLHARNAYTGQRVLCGGYVNREDFLSKLRVTGLQAR